MYVGHFGVALGAKGMRPGMALWVLLVAVVGADLVEKIARLIWSEPLGVWFQTMTGTFLTAGGVSVLYFFWKKSWEGALIVLLAGLSHALLDLPTDPVTIWQGGPTVELHLYNSPLWDFFLEALLVGIGWGLYRSSLPEKKRNRWEVQLMLPILLVLQACFNIGAYLEAW